MAETTVKKRAPRTQTEQPKQEVVIPTPHPVVEETPEATYCVLAVDNGGWNIKILADYMDEPVSILSHKGYGKDMGVFSNYPIPNDGQSYILEVDTKIIFTGQLIHNARGKMNPFVDDKSADTFIYSTLLACALYGADYIDLVTTIPYNRYRETDDDEKIKNILLGTHTIKVNREVYTFTISNVLVTPEGMIAANFLKPEGLTRLLDLASRTVGFASTLYIDGQAIPIPDDSGTIEREGLNFKEITSWEAYVSNIMYDLQRLWKTDDRVIAFGGGALVEDLITELRKYFPKLEVAEDPVFVQVRGMLAAGVEIFGQEDDLDEEE